MPAKPGSIVDRHPQKALIDSLLVDGAPLRDIASRITPSISIMALHRYKHKYIQPTLEGAKTLSKALQDVALAAGKDGGSLDPQAVTRLAIAADPLLTRIARHQQVTDDAIVDARSKKDPRGVAALISTDYKGLELHAKLTGRLADAQGPQVNIAIVCPASSQPQVSEQDGGVVLDIKPGR